MYQVRENLTFDGKIMTSFKKIVKNQVAIEKKIMLNCFIVHHHFIIIYSLSQHQTVIYSNAI